MTATNAGSHLLSHMNVSTVGLNWLFSIWEHEHPRQSKSKDVYKVITFDKTSVNPYRQKLAELYETVLTCPHYTNSCATELKAGYRPGPEISYVGSAYGIGCGPRVLVARISPNWQQNVPSMGTREFFERMSASHSSLKLDEMFDAMRDHWIDPNGGTLFQGYNCMNTMVGKKNLPIRDICEFHSRPFAYGAKLILKELAKTGVLRVEDGDLLDFFAANNMVKCSGKEKKGNPTEMMHSNCFSYFSEEMRILEPQIVITFGKLFERGKTRDSFPSKAMIRNFPHPAFYPHIWGPQHPPLKDLPWKYEEEMEYKGCKRLRDDVQTFAKTAAEVFGQA
jgi:hypothetical protein